MIFSNSQLEISVIIPAYNRAASIVNTINSVLTQKGCTFEIIIVDDCSTDNTENAIRSLNNKIISFYKLHKNRGSQYARNYGAERAKSELLIFLDSDDALLPNSLYSRLKYFESNPDCESSYSDYEVCFKGVNRDYKKNVIVNDLTYRDVLTRLAVVPTSLLMIRKNVFNEIGKFDENLPACHDDDIYIQCFKRNKCHYISTVTVQFINHSGPRVGSSINLANGRAIIIEKYKDEIVKELGSKGLRKHTVKNSIDYLFLNDIKNYKKSWSKINSKSLSLYCFFIFESIKRILFKLARRIRAMVYKFE